MPRQLIHKRTEGEVRKIMAVHSKCGAAVARERFGLTPRGLDSVVARFKIITQNNEAHT